MVLQANKSQNHVHVRLVEETQPNLKFCTTAKLRRICGTGWICGIKSNWGLCYHFVFVKWNSDKIDGWEISATLPPQKRQLHIFPLYCATAHWFISENK